MLVTIKSATTIKTAIVVTAAPTHWQQYLKRLKKPKINSCYFKCALRSSSVSQVAVLAEVPKKLNVSGYTVQHGMHILYKFIVTTILSKIAHTNTHTHSSYPVLFLFCHVPTYYLF